MQPALGHSQHAAIVPTVSERAQSHGPSAAQWEAIKPTVRRLYVVDKRPLRDVVHILEQEYGFRATQRMFKGRISQWEFNKNIRAEDWAAIATLHKTRKDAGKGSTEFLVHGKRKTVTDLLRYIKSRNMTEEEFLVVAMRSTVPAHVHCYSPDPEKPENSPLPSSGDDASTFSPEEGKNPSQSSPSSSQFTLSPFHETSSQSYSDVLTPLTKITECSPPDERRQMDDNTDESDDYVMVPRDITAVSRPPDLECDQVQQDIGRMASQLVRPTSLIDTYNTDDISSFQLVAAISAVDGTSQPPHICSSCRRPTSTQHFISLERLAPQATPRRNLLNDSDERAMTLPSTTRELDDACKWVALCFSACICSTRGQLEFSARSLTDAAVVFENMLKRQDRLIFTALHLMVTMLHMHNQSDIAESVVGSAAAVAQRLLQPQNPIRLTLEWELAAAGLGLRESDLGSGMLRQIYVDFETELTLSHPWTIAALYNLAWMLLYEGLDAEDDESQSFYTEAEELLQKVYVASCASLGLSHMQSITALTTLARAQSYLCKTDKAIENYKKAIHDCKYTLGRSHPYRLEAKRRLALAYQTLGQKEKMEHLYWEVLRGRIMMLGSHHPFTEGAKVDLIALLKDLDKWEDNGPLQWQIDEAFEHTSETSSQHEAF